MNVTQQMQYPYQDTYVLTVTTRSFRYFNGRRYQVQQTLRHFVNPRHPSSNFTTVHVVTLQMTNIWSPKITRARYLTIHPAS